MLSKLSIRAKLIGIVSFFLLTLAATNLFGMFQMRSINASAQQIQTVWLPSVRWLGDMQTQAARYRAILRDHFLTFDDNAKAKIDKNLAARLQAYDQANQTYQALISSPEERAVYGELVKVWKEYLAAANEVLETSRKGESSMAQDLNFEKASPIGIKVDETLTKLVEMNSKGAAIEGQRANDSYSTAVQLGLVILGLALVAGLAFSFYLVRGVTTGIASIVTPMKALGEGDLTAVVPHQGEKTEIGTMADTLQVFKDALIAKKAADEAAARDADAKIQRGQRVDAITRDFEKLIGELVGSLSSSSTELEAAANTLTTTADSTGKISDSAASASQEVSSNVQSVAVATEEITSSVAEIGRQVQESSRIAADAVRQAQKTDASITELSQAAARIGDVVKLITAVAEQTNLLALNATIEAARAGDAGRGFAVVASEVKALAAQTAKATDEISAQIASMQSATRESVATIKEIGSTINLISEISSSIAAAVEEQGAATQEIARNVQYAAQRSGEVAGSITEVSRGAGETGAASGQVLSSAQVLSSDSSRLKIEVEKFLTTVRAA
ncbi:MAG: MCP four helix bundle domain-containing protein [Afipia sp.]|jgi:methyl-accepting chemotaxis protein|nr:MCP four helix bundle domain-containing protein [Afipia sp.]MBS4006417.1 MCP four helix bundle domain-containing protein [Afipia sp.]WIG52261.1 MAG: Methyl-accepting chemotaxis sensor/transducer protein [Afipia sp.]